MKPPLSPLEAHKIAGRHIEVSGLQTFVREEGEGEPVVCMHGVPSSSFLYRRMLPHFAERGYKGVAFDLVGMGLTDRPKQFDYSWTGLGKWATKATEALKLDRFHLVVHDVGGPIGFEMLAAHPERILSLTILNTLLVGVGSFQKPFVMKPFEISGIGELYLATLIPPILRQLMYLQGVSDKKAFRTPEARAYVQLLKGKDGGKAFLQIMRSFEPTPEKEAIYTQAVRNLHVPKQVIWGEKDPALSLKQYGLPIQKELGVDRLFTVPGKHFLQEDQAEAIVDYFVEMNA